MDQIKIILPHTWVITLKTWSLAAKKQQKKAQVTTYQGTFTFSSEISLFVNSSTDTATGAIWTNLLHNIS